MTAEQRTDLRNFLSELNNQRRPLDRLRADLDQARLASHRVLLAIYELQEEMDAKSQRDISRCLNFQQRAIVRQRYRQELAQMKQQTMKPVVNAYGLTPMDGFLANDDLLSVLSQPDVQQTLQITDEQWLRIEAVKKDAYPAARELIVKLSKELAAKPIEETPKRSSLLTDMIRDSLAVLTPEQTERYEALMKERQQKLALANEQKDLVEATRLSKFHGMPVPFPGRIPRGARQFQATPYNLFAETEFVERLSLTAAQQQAIASVVQNFEAALLQAHNEYLLGENSPDQRVQKLRELVLPHNRQFQSQLANLLTSPQNEALTKLKWRGLGLPALLKPEIAGQLNLSGEQKAAIEAQFKIPPPQMKLPAKPGDFEEFRKNSEEYQKKSREHSEMLTAKVWAQLTPTQVEKFTMLTGLAPPPMKSAPVEKEAAPASK